MIRLGKSPRSLTSHDSSARSKRPALPQDRRSLPPSNNRLHPRREQIHHRRPQSLRQLQQLAITDPPGPTLNLRNCIALNVPAASLTGGGKGGLAQAGGGSQTADLGADNVEGRSGHRAGSST